MIGFTDEIMCRSATAYRSILMTGQRIIHSFFITPIGSTIHAIKDKVTRTSANAKRTARPLQKH